MSELSKGHRKLSLAGKKEALQLQLASAQDTSAVAVLAFGAHDPKVVALFECDSCSGAAILTEVKRPGKRTRWQVICSECTKNSGEASKNPWTASLLWNGINLTSCHYCELPLFGLAGMSPKEAHDHIKAIRGILVLRISLSDTEIQLFRAGQSTRKPGTAYTERLDAYLKWAMLAHRMIKACKGRASNKIL
ncbi:MAG: hypothetical protein ACNJA3_28625 (plasmid) [Pseudomonas rhizophila]|uniref:hypothetical protein n=1 Tax=Pseudomonas rhizophila TaxID=2045200 RepID=UPI003F6C9E6D